MGDVGRLENGFCPCRIVRVSAIFERRTCDNRGQTLITVASLSTSQ